MTAFKGRKILVTGAAQGIGLAIAEEFSRRGATLVIADMNRDNAEREAGRLADEHGVPAHAVIADVSTASGAKAMVDRAAQAMDGLDALVNNAGILHTQTIEETTEAAWDKVMAVNLKGVFFACQAALPHFRKASSPRIVNIASMAGRNGGLKTGLAYSASKGGVIALSRGLARQLAAEGVNVNVVCPGTTDSAIIRAWPKETIAALEATIPAGRLGQPDEIASVVCFLASKEASFVTGATLDVNGGQFIG